MRTLLVVGIGAGNPEHLTLQALSGIGRASTFFLLDKGAAASELVGLRRELIVRYARPGAEVVELPDPPRDRAPADYGAEVVRWHDARAALVSRAVSALAEDAVAAFLVWGDPSLYDSTLRVLARLDVAYTLEVVPGITAIQALTAAHGVTLNRVGGPVVVTTGRRLAAEGMTADDVVVLLDADDGWRAVDGDVEILWGGCLGTPDQVLVGGRIADVGAEISRVRADLRARKGWVMDTYLLRRQA